MPARILTSKLGNKNFYKGKGSGPMGRWTAKGKYLLEPFRFRQFMIPDLAGCQLTPYVNPNIPKSKSQFTHSVRDYFMKDTLPNDLPPSLVANMQRAAKDVTRALSRKMNGTPTSSAAATATAFKPDPATAWLPDHSILKKKKSVNLFSNRDKTFQLYDNHNVKPNQKPSATASRARTMQLYEAHPDIPFYLDDEEK
ncbi:mitochondrial ribosomal protein L27-domain-containing protein [Obelidium mucronatum]|nr:mitochondrial ribosomal protein L27-domain-containing protein [Obelidium mucronatum]